MEKRTFTPLYKRLTNHYRQKIIRQELLPESRIDSINEIMRLHDVSRETAKLVLRNLASEGLVQPVAGKGTFVSNEKKIRKEWGIIVPFYSSNMENLISHLAYEAELRGRKIQYYIDYNKAGEETDLVGKLIREGFEAIILVPNYDESLTSDFYRQLDHWKTKIVLIDNTMSGSYFNYIIQSYDLGVKRAYDYFRSKNKRNLLFIKDDSWRGKNLVHELMEQTLRAFIEKEDPTGKLYVACGIRNLQKEKLDRNKIGGILTSTDVAAVRITGRLKRWNISVPGQISVVSYGNTDLTEFFRPSITSVDCRYGEMAACAAEFIINSVKRNTKYQQVIQPELILRET